MTAPFSFASDYMEGAAPAVIRRLTETNMLKTPGYGTDAFSEAAREKIRAACASPAAAVHFLVGGTQTNATVIGALLRSYEGVIAPASGHISTHEAGAIEAGGHKVLPLPQTLGKLRAEDLSAYMDTYNGDANADHTVKPGMVYISQPTEYGTLYSLAELSAISAICKKEHLPLYVDGARLAYALAAPGNDVFLPDLARLCDAFYIGGTKCGALFGEAVVIPDPALLPHFFTVIKQHGALLAKGRLLGLQFDALFTDGLYTALGRNAVETAARMKAGLATAGFSFRFDSPTNQIFVIVENDRLAALSAVADYSFWEKYDETRTVIRLATSWATDMAEVERFNASLREM